MESEWTREHRRRREREEDRKDAARREREAERHHRAMEAASRQPCSGGHYDPSYAAPAVDRPRKQGGIRFPLFCRLADRACSSILA